MDLEIALSLDSSWTIYENYYTLSKQDYAANIQKVVSFDSVQELTFLLKNTIYSSITKLFTNIEVNNKLRVFPRSNFDNPEDQTDRQVVIDALCVFRNNIKPEWEDPANKKGGEIQLEIKANYYHNVNGFYQDLILEILGGSNPLTQCVNGIRILDKLRGLPANIRFDIWLNFNPKRQEFQAVTTSLIQVINDILSEHNLQVDLKMVSHT